MISRKLSLVLVTLLFATSMTAAPDHTQATSAALHACREISQALSNASAVYFPPSANYTLDNEHWAITNTAPSVCSVEPGSAADVAKILDIIARTRVPFAVKGGGHSTNPGFSSTLGVQISMSRFSAVTLHRSNGIVDIGTGLVWDEVYDALNGSGVIVVGGRVPGVGVAGFTLGGGFSWLSNRYGLTIDTIQAYELVLPTGKVVTVTEEDEDLWFGLRGGLNNFGIVTKFTLKTFPQGQVWGGLYFVSTEHQTEFHTAVANFSANTTDPKAALNAAYLGSSAAPGLAGLLFYDGPSPPPGVFDGFLSIPPLTSTLQTSSFASFVASLGVAVSPPGFRVSYSAAPVLQYTESLSSVIANESVFWGAHLSALDTNASVTYVAEPLVPTVFSHGAPSAFPPDRSHAIFPTNLAFSWTNASLDAAIHAAIQQSTRTIISAAIAEGQDVEGAAVYTNYALYDTPLKNIYGDNLDRLRKIKREWDPENVMNLAGGFRF